LIGHVAKINIDSVDIGTLKAMVVSFSFATLNWTWPLI
jgi:hypothetical protein